MENDVNQINLPKTKKRAQKRYWREIKGHLYARLQYQDDTGKWKEKLKPISDKRTAFRVVEEMKEVLFYNIVLTGSHEVRGSIPLDSTNLILIKSTPYKGFKVSFVTCLFRFECLVSAKLFNHINKSLKNDL